MATIAEPDIVPPIASRTRAWLARHPVANLALSILAANRRRTITTALGCALATALMLYQGSLIYGFLRAGGMVVSASGADAWAVTHGSKAMEYMEPVDRRYVSLAMRHPAVRGADCYAIGFALWTNPEGVPLSVLVVGGAIDRFTAGRAVDAWASRDIDGAILVERSALGVLELQAAPRWAEIGGRRALIAGSVTGYGSFLGGPTVLTSLAAAQRFLGMRSDQCSAVGIMTRAGTTASAVAATLGSDFSELDVHATRDFGLKTATFWLLQTGAGGGLLLSALLGFFIGLTIVSQSLYSNALENYQHYLTLRALGVASHTIRAVVVAQAMALALAGGVIGLLLCVPIVPLTANFVVSWIYTPVWLPALVLLVTLPLGRASAVSTTRMLSGLDPAEAFRR